MANPYPLESTRGELSPETGAALKAARLRLGFTLRRTAGLAQITNGHLCNMEQARRRPSVQVALRLAAVLRLDDETAMALIDEAAPSDRPNEFF